MAFEVFFIGSQKANVAMIPVDGDFAFRFTQKTEEELLSCKYEDARALSRNLVDWFLAIQTPEDALQFLATTGNFLWDGHRQDEAGYLQPLTWSEFKQWQSVIVDISTSGFFVLRRSKETGEIEVPESFLKNPIAQETFNGPDLTNERKLLFSSIPEEILDGLNGHQPIVELGSRYHPPPELTTAIEKLNAKCEAEKRSATPEELEKLKNLNPIDDFGSKCSFECVLEARAYTTVEAMLIRIYVEQLEAIEYLKCKRPGCGKRFEKKFKHEKNYCDQKCAHHDHVMKSKKKSQRKEAKGKNNG
jgi:hypothetical protein